MENKKIDTKKLIILGIIIFFILVGGTFILFKDKIFNNEIDDNNVEIEETTDADIVISKEVNFTIDELTALILTVDLTLSEPLSYDRIINIEVKAYDESNNLLHTYIASTKYFDVVDNTEIHLAFNDVENDDVSNITRLETKVMTDERTVDPLYEYKYVINDNPEVKYFIYMYRVFMDLDESFYSNSGVASIEYEDGTKVLDRISYLEDENYIGVSYEEDFSTRNSSPLSKVSVYKIGTMFEK